MHLWEIWACLGLKHYFISSIRFKFFHEKSLSEKETFELPLPWRICIRSSFIIEKIRLLGE